MLIPEMEPCITRGTAATATFLVVLLMLIGNAGNVFFMGVFHWSWRLRTRDNTYQVNIAAVNFLAINISCPTFLYLLWQAVSRCDDDVTWHDLVIVKDPSDPTFFGLMANASGEGIKSYSIPCQVLDLTEVLISVVGASHIAIGILRLCKAYKGIDYVVPGNLICIGLGSCWLTGLGHAIVVWNNDGGLVYKELCGFDPRSKAVEIVGYAMTVKAVVALGVCVCYGLIFRKIRRETQVGTVALWFMAVRYRASYYSTAEDDLQTDGPSGLAYCTASEILQETGKSNCAFQNDVGNTLRETGKGVPGVYKREERSETKSGQRDSGFQNSEVSISSDLGVKNSEKVTEIIVSNGTTEKIIGDLEGPLNCYRHVCQTSVKNESSLKDSKLSILPRASLTQFATAAGSLAFTCLTLAIIAYSTNLSARVLVWAFNYFIFACNPYVYLYSSKEFRRYARMLVASIRG